MRKHLRQMFAIAGACAIAVASAACSGDDNKDADDIEAVIRAFERSYEGQDFAAFEATHTVNGMKAELDGAEEDLDTDDGRRAAFATVTEEDTLTIDSIADIKVDGDTATAYVEAVNKSREDAGPTSILQGVNPSFVKEDGDWKIDGLEFVSPRAPDGATSVRVDLNEFAFAFDPGDIPDGEFYFEMANVGEQDHHVFIAKIPDDLNIETALMSEEDPEGVVDVGGTLPWEPGTTQNIVFTNELDAGRYVMLCFMPDTDDPEMTPHAFKGMYKDFRIE